MKAGSQVNELGHTTVSSKRAGRVRKDEKKKFKKSIRRQMRDSVRDDEPTTKPVKTKGWAY